MLKEDVQVLKQDILIMKTNIRVLNRAVAKLDYRVKNVELTLENVTNRNINHIAEGHLDLSRKLDEAIKSGRDNELLYIRVNYLENVYRQVKDKVDCIA